MLTEFVRQAVQTVGIEGVSAGVLALLFAVALYAHKAGSAANRLVHAGSTARHDVMVVAVVLALLLAVGVLEGVDVARARTLGHSIGRWIAQLPVSRWVEQLT